MTRDRGHFRERYPLFFAYGERHKFLSREEAANASPAERIQSVWPFLAGRVIAFHESLTPRAQANYDPEDILTELWLELRQKDHKYDPSRGRYITFATKIVGHRLYHLRDVANTVHSPRNSASRLKNYQEADGDGRLTDKRRQTATLLRRAAAGLDTLDATAQSMPVPAPDEAAASHEAARLARAALIAAVCRLDAPEAAVFGRLVGLWGREPIDIDEVASAMGCPTAAVRKIQERAAAKVRQILVDLKHPSASAE